MIRILIFIFFGFTRYLWNKYKRISIHLKSNFSKIKLLNKNVRFLKGSIIDSKSIFEGYNSIGEKSVITSCYFGLGTYIGVNKFFNIKFGRFCSIGSHVKIITGEHPTTKFVSTHPSFFSVSKASGFTFVKEQKFKEIKHTDNGFLVEIENDVWIGDNVTILSGVKIGNGAIIGSNSFVNKDILPYTINVGIPAKPVKSRFTEDQIINLLNFSWWQKDINWIKDNAEIFSDIKTFTKKMNNEN